MNDEEAFGKQMLDLDRIVREEVARLFIKFANSIENFHNTGPTMKEHLQYFVDHHKIPVQFVWDAEDEFLCGYVK